MIRYLLEYLPIIRCSEEVGQFDEEWRQRTRPQYHHERPRLESSRPHYYQHSSPDSAGPLAITAGPGHSQEDSSRSRHGSHSRGYGWPTRIFGTHLV